MHGVPVQINSFESTYPLKETDSERAMDAKDVRITYGRETCPTGACTNAYTSVAVELKGENKFGMGDAVEVTVGSGVKVVVCVTEGVLPPCRRGHFAPDGSPAA